MKIITVKEDSKYYEVEIEKSDFLDIKNKIDTTYKGAELAFVNSSAKLVFYRKRDG